MTQLIIPLADRITRQNQFWYGDGEPSPLMGRQGDYYFRFDQVGVYYKDTTVTWTQYGESGGAFDPVYLFDNLIYNGDFGLWTFQPSTSLGYSTYSRFTNFWAASTTSGSTATITKDTVNLDPNYNTNYVVNAAITCIGGTDSVYIAQDITTVRDVANFNPVINHPISMSSRIKLVSGSVQAALYMQAQFGGTIVQTFTSPFITLTNSYFTFKFENQIPVTTQNVDTLTFGIQLQGNGTVTISNMMVAVNPAAPNFRPQLIPNAVGANLLTNGGFDIWQRGAGPFTSGFFADRWQISPASGDTISVVTDGANNDVLSLRCAACTYTLGTGGTSLFQQIVINPIDQFLRQSNFTFSMRVRTSTANAVRIGINGTLQVFSNYHPGDGQYHTLTATTYVGNPNNWQVFAQFNASCTAYLDNAMLVVGSTPADYVPLHPADDLARCLRYYETIGPGAWYPVIWGYQTAGAFIAAGYPYKARKAITPSVTQAGTFVLSNATGGGPISSAIDGLSIQIGATATGTAFLNSNSSGYYIAEANP